MMMMMMMMMTLRRNEDKWIIKQTTQKQLFQIENSMLKKFAIYKR